MSLVRNRLTRLARAASAIVLAAVVAIFAAPAPASAQYADCHLQVHYNTTQMPLFGHKVEVTVTNISTNPINVDAWKMRFDYRTPIGKGVYSPWGAQITGAKTSITAVNPHLVLSPEGGYDYYHLYPDMSRTFGFTLQSPPLKPQGITLLPTVPGGLICELDAAFNPRPLVG